MAPTTRLRRGNDEELVDALKRGEHVPFDEIYRAYLPRVRAVCRRYLRDPRDVEEAVQDTFVKAAHALSRFNGSFRLGAWLGRIAANTAIDASRRNQRRPEVTSDVAEHLPDAAIPESDSYDREGEAHEVLNRLRPEHARALHLRGVHEATHVEIAAAMGKTPDQAKALLHRARESFRRAWQDIGGQVAFMGAAGAFGLWRVYRAAAASSPVVTRLQSAAGAAESVAAPAALVTDAWPWI